MRLFILIGLLAAASAPAQSISVRPGDDLQQACDQARVVTLESGVHYLAGPIILEAKHSGLKIVGRPGAVISGGLPLTDWREESPGVWLTEAPAGTQILRVGDEWAPMARTPTYDPEHPTIGG